MNKRVILVLFSITLVLAKSVDKDTVKVEKGDGCTSTLNPVVDILLERYGNRFNQLFLPNITTPDVEMFNPVLSGLASMSRICDITLHLNDTSKNFTAEICLKAADVSLMTILKLHYWIKDFVSLTVIEIKNIQVRVKCTIPLQIGGPVYVNEVTVTNIDSINIDNSGLLGGLDFAVNAALKMGVKKILIRTINENVAKAVNAALDKYPI